MRIGALLGNRVSLRRASERDTQVIEAWYEEAAKAAYFEHSLNELWRSADEERGALLTIVRPDRDGPIGLLEYEVKHGEMTVPFIALAKAYRGWGYGSEAMRLLEEWAVREGIAERFRAEMDVRNGLGLYFWLRLGYRPAGWHAEDGRDSMTMVREIETAEK